MTRERKDGDFLARLLSALQIADIADPTAALETIVTSLATLLKSTGIPDILTLTETVDFAPLKSLMRLPREDLLRLDEIVARKRKTLMPEHIFENQVRVARLLSPTSRKVLAAYYTKPFGLKIMTRLTAEYARTYKCPMVLSDPFLGSGLTISETVKGLEPSCISNIWGVEIDPLSALVAYAAIVHSLRGDYSKVNVIVGDAFKVVHQRPLRIEPAHEADVILTNPPFTRWEILDASYRALLSRLVRALGYDKYVQRQQLNLQLVSLFLIDYVLRENGLLVAVLPASTFYTLYGEAAKALLRDKYSIRVVVEHGLESSFSIDSGFKELMLVALKGRSERNHETAFVTLESDDDRTLEKLSNIFKGSTVTDSRINWVRISEIPYPWHMNWLTLFGQNPLRELLTEVFTRGVRTGAIATWLDIFGEEHIVRGVEMYGPDFFFIPNKYWKVVHIGAEDILIRNVVTGKELRVDREFAVPALRKPELYVDSIIPRVEHYFLSIPPENVSELSPDICEYIEWGVQHSTATPAMKAFGRYWYSHVFKQIRTKKPFGRVFLPDKIDPSFKRRGVFANYSDEPLTASKNFYIITYDHVLGDKALALWFNSSFFIAYFTVASRKISEQWSRFLEEDYLRMPVLNVTAVEKHELQKLASIFDRIAKRKLEPIKYQLGKTYRLEIDSAMLEIIGIETSTTLQRLYSLLESVLRDPSSSTKYYSQYHTTLRNQKDIFTK